MWNWRKTLFYKTSDSSRGVWALGFFSESHPKSSTAGTDLRSSFACWQWALPGVRCVCRQVSPSLPGVLPVKKHRPWNPLPRLCMTSVTGQLSCLLIRENPWAREWWGGGRQPKGAALLAWGAQPGVEPPPSTPPAPWQGVLLQQFVIGGKKNPKINHELRKEKEERTQCLKQVWKSALLSFTARRPTLAMSSQQVGKHTNKHPNAGKETQFTQTEIASSEAHVWKSCSFPEF